MSNNPVKTIAVLTSGGDAPGMNAAVRAVTRVSQTYGLRVLGVRRGYAGLLKDEMSELAPSDVGNIVERGGTFLYTARSQRFMEKEGRQEAAAILRSHDVDALVAIGGDGTFRGALELSKEGINVIAVPATIDLDLACTDYTIGFDTAVNTAMEAIDRIRDTSTAHERISVIEVMGRKAGYIALWTSIACGAEEVLLPETYDYNDRALIDRIKERVAAGKKQHIIVNAEGIGQSESLAARIENATGIQSRATNLGYLQRGGSPTCKDRVYASLMGEKAVDALLAGHRNRAIVHLDGEFKDIDLAEALNMTKEIPENYLALTVNLVRHFHK
ncbi:MAG: 6-phosphofructokinase [Lachnospiraceae bacterium]|nr:6-phosphofructokinase [Lachnospiraceae bacterium]